MSDDKDVNTLFMRYESEVSDLIYRQLGCRSDAAELTRETFQHYVRITQWLTIENPRDLLFKIANALVVEFLRCASIATKVIEKCSRSEETLDAAPTIEQENIDADEWRRVMAIIDSLPPRCLDILIRRKVDGLSYAEIIEKLNVSHSEFGGDILQVMHILRKQFNR